MRKISLPLSALAVIALALLAVPALASAAPGWKLPKVTSNDGALVIKSTGKHCGASKFGAYTFKNRASKPGQWAGTVTWRSKLTRNEKLHQAKQVRFGGDIPPSWRKRTRNLLDNVRFRQAGDPALVESVRKNGSVQATRPFNPRRANVAGC